MNKEDVIRDAIVRANKLGARGIQVTGFTEPKNASDKWEYSLAINVDPDRGKTASQRAWYEE